MNATVSFSKVGSHRRRAPGHGHIESHLKTPNKAHAFCPQDSLAWNLERKKIARRTCIQVDGSFLDG